MSLVLLADDVLKFVRDVAHLRSPEIILDALDAIAWRHGHMHVLGAALIPIVYGPRTGQVEPGKSLFLHKSVPKGWWQDYAALTARSPAPASAVARLGIGPYTLTEVTQMLEPVGEDRTVIDVHLKHGIRDLLACPIAGRWVFAFWSKRVITMDLDGRALLFLAAAFASRHLQKFVAPHPQRVPKGADITPRELAVLRALSIGLRPGEIAKRLNLGVETVRSHLKKAQWKLGADTSTGAVAFAMRLRLIP